MQVLFINNFYNLFDKVDCGASQRSMCLLMALAKIAQVDVISFVGNTISNLDNVTVIYSHDIDASNNKRGRFNKFIKLFKWREPYSIFHKNDEKEQIIDQFVARKKYDYIIIRYLQFACDCGLLKYKNQLFIDFDDDLRDVIRMEARHAKSFRNKVYGLIYANTIHWLSCYVAKRIHHAFYSSPKRALPNSLYLPNISTCQEHLPLVKFAKTKPVILIVGNFRYFPNAYGLLYFLKHIYPSIRAHVTNVELHVVGNIPKDMHDRIKPYILAGVKLCGYVPDLVEEYRQCRCVAIPLYHGTGTSVKLIEAMSLNRAVVSTSIGVRGLHQSFLPNNVYLLSDDNTQFANAIVRLLEDEKLNHQICSSAVRKIKEYYSVQRFNEIIIRTFDE